MKILILKPTNRKLHFTYMDSSENKTILSDKLFGVASDQENIIENISDRIHEIDSFNNPDAVAIRVKYGGEDFNGPVPASPEVISKLENMVSHAPLHIPLVLELIRECESTFSEIPVILVFETAFFSCLPPREYGYALKSNLLKDMGIRRFGYNGIYHGAASKYIKQKLNRTFYEEDLKILSICLEPQPEVAAVIGDKPVMVTSGSTPLEGIPGQTTCGEIDPTIVFTLAHSLNYGPEQINSILTRESGLYGLTGKEISYEELWNSNDDEVKAAAKVIEYRFLLACGSGISAMSGLDGIVFSGKYASAGKILGKSLIPKLLCGIQHDDVKVDFLEDSLDKIIADEILNVVELAESKY